MYLLYACVQGECLYSWPCPVIFNWCPRGLRQRLSRGPTRGQIGPKMSCPVAWVKRPPRVRSRCSVGTLTGTLHTPTRCMPFQTIRDPSNPGGALTHPPSNAGHLNTLESCGITMMKWSTLSRQGAGRPAVGLASQPLSAAAAAFPAASATSPPTTDRTEGLPTPSSSRAGT